MTETEGVIGILSAAGILEQLGKAFIELKSKSEGFTSYGIMWEEIKEHFTKLESSLNKKLEELDEKEKTLEEKASASEGLVFGREAEVAAKEQAYLDRIQELKDAAVASIAEARKNYKVPSPEPADVVGDKQTKLTESFPPVPLLKDYLLTNSSQEKSGHDGASGAQDAGALELGALRAVLRCIEEYNLQTEYPPSPLRKRVAELEKAKADKKRTGGATKFHGKKPRGTGGYTPRAPAVHADYKQDYRQAQPRAFDERGLHAGSSERYPYSVARSSYNFQVPAHTSSYGPSSYGPAPYGPTSYEPSSYGPSSYGSASYASASYASQANVQSQRSYYYQDERVPPTSYASSGYGDYAGTGFQSSSHQSYM